MSELAPGLRILRAGPSRTLNAYLLGDVLLDSGLRWSGRLLAPQLRGTRVSAHALTHVHADHAGSAAWLCERLGVPLWVGAADAQAMRTGRVDVHDTLALDLAVRALRPVRAREVDRPLVEGDVVGGFEVLEVPGHSPGSLAFWRSRDRVLVTGDALANLAVREGGAHVVVPPGFLSSAPQQAQRSAERLARLRPRVAAFGHGHPVTDPGRLAALLGTG